MASSLCYYIFILFLRSVCTAKETNATRYKGRIEFDDGILNFVNFVAFFNHRLINDSAVVESRAVKNEEECIETCTENANCRSVNFKTIPDANGKYNCQILGTDKFADTSDSFVPSLDFHHFSFTVCLFKEIYSTNCCLALYISIIWGKVINRERERVSLNFIR